LASARAVIRPGAQLIEFDLGERADWLVCRRLEWARFDLGYFYEGRLRVARVGFLP